MDKKNWQQAKRIIFEALEQPRAERGAFMDVTFVIFLLLLPSCIIREGRFTTREQAFDTSVLEKDLVRGRSTRVDVERLLGEASGVGSLLVPGKNRRSIWYYEKFDLVRSGRRFAVNQDVLLVFFEDDRFDGFLWYSDAEVEP